MARRIPAFIVLLLALAWSAPAAAQGIRRCVDPRGVSIFTDRPCEEMNAVPMQAPPASEGNLAEGFRGGFSQRGCARRPEELLDRVRAALEARDVNRLASHYHWSGTGTGSGNRLMDTLERIASQPLVSAELVYPEPAAQPDYREPVPSAAPPTEYPQSARDGEPLADRPAPPPAPPRQIRILQMRTDQAEQATSTVFQLRRNAGCWWIQL